MRRLLSNVSFILAISASASTMAAQPSTEFPTPTKSTQLNVASASGDTRHQSNEVIWIDVRTAEEFASGHLSQAHHIPFQDIRARITEVTQNRGAIIKLYCRSGRRASWAKEDLEAAGYTNVINEGGYSQVKHLSE
jgi:phage shock protein E